MRNGSVAASLHALPSRFRGPGPHDGPLRYRLKVGRTGRDVVVYRDRAVVGGVGDTPDAEILTDPETWSAIDSGAMSGIEAFGARRLSVRGSIEQALRFETWFERSTPGGLRYSIERLGLGGLDISVLLAGSPEDPPLLLLHGLGATKASWLTVIPQLAAAHRVVALDLPGFGASSKPRGTYDAGWFSDHAFGVMDVLGIDRAFVAGNSMGGRIAQEMAMRDDRRVRGIACLCPATAFSRRPLLWLARLTRPEVGMLVGRLPRARLQQDLKALFSEPTRIDDGWYQAAIDDFLHVWKSPRARRAFSCALKNIYMEEPDGENGFWSRLAGMSVPALYIYGAHDVLITPRFVPKIHRALPAAEVSLWPDCGHVPQLEHPDRTAKALLDFFTSAVRPPARRAGGGGRIRPVVEPVAT